MLNTSRIGHGFSLDKHPKLVDMVKAKGIAIEVCPISNQMLKLLVDMRTHPATSLMSRGVPVTISNDDPAVYGYNGLEYDFYMAYMAWNLTMADLKQLTQNSITYSSLPDTLKSIHLKTLSSNWNTWIANLAQLKKIM